MAKHEITIVSVTVDKDIVDQARLLGIDDVSTLVNPALKEHVERLAHRAALGEWLDEMDEKYGPPSEEAMAEARAAFDELDGISEDRGAA